MRKLLLAFLIALLIGNAAAQDQNGTGVENVTLTLDFNLTSSDKIYFDNEEVDTGEFTSAEFPYIIAEGGAYFSGIVADTFIRAERDRGGENQLVLQRRSETSSFMVPLTYGNRFDVESREDLVTSNRFLQQLMPSFGFFMPEKATVKTSLDPSITLESSISIGQGTYMLEIKKTGENQVRITRK